MPIMCWLQHKKGWDFSAKIDRSLLTYLSSQSVDYIRPVVSKDQRVGKIKWNDIEVQNHTVTSRENYGQVSNFRDGAV